MRVVMCQTGVTNNARASSPSRFALRPLDVVIIRGRLRCRLRTTHTRRYIPTPRTIPPVTAPAIMYLLPLCACDGVSVADTGTVNGSTEEARPLLSVARIVDLTGAVCGAGVPIGDSFVKLRTVECDDCGGDPTDGVGDTVMVLAEALTS
jgi:hypothetical protein